MFYRVCTRPNILICDWICLLHFKRNTPYCKLLVNTENFLSRIEDALFQIQKDVKL